MSIAIYKRVSTKRQDTAAQAHELDAYRKILISKGETVREYSDKFTSKRWLGPVGKSCGPM